VKPRLKLAPGQPTPQSKLTDAVQDKICGLIADGAPYAIACRQCDIARATFWNWRVWGTADPKGRYGRFFTAIKKALRRQEACRLRRFQLGRRLAQVSFYMEKFRKNNVPRGL
jgi:hypothetical protein